MTKNLMTVKEIADAGGVTAEAVGHYVKIGLLVPRKNPQNHYKEFTQQDLKFVKFIRQAKHLGYTLMEIKEIIQHSHDGVSPCPTVRKIIESRIEENRQKLQELIALQERMENAVMQWESLPDKLPDGDSICHLIEGIVDID